MAEVDASPSTSSAIAVAALGESKTSQVHSVPSRLCAAVAPSPAAPGPSSAPQTVATSTPVVVDTTDQSSGSHGGSGGGGGAAAPFPEVVELNVGGHFFTTRLSTLRKDESSMLAAMFSGRHRVDRDSCGRYFIDRDGGDSFAPILNYLRHGELPRVERALDVYREALYYNLSGLIHWCETQPNVIAEMMFKHAREWLGPAYDGFKDRLLLSARHRFTTSPESYLDDKIGYFDLTFAFTRPERSRPAAAADGGSGGEGASAVTPARCTDHTFSQDTPKYDAVLPAGLDFDMTLNFLRRDFHEAGLTTEWSPIYSDSKSTCRTCHMRVYFVYFRVVLWHWVASPVASPGATSV